MGIETQTKVEIISNALILLGEKPLSSLTDDRYGATVGTNLFEQIYQNELQSNRWRFAVAKKQCSLLVSDPLNEWENAFQIPAESLLVLGTYPSTPYEIYGDRIYSNAATCEIEYVFKPEITELPSYFTILLTYALARDMIKPITESDNGVQVMTQKYVMQRDRAMYADAQQRPNKPIRHRPFTAPRGGDSGSSRF